ncbi:hypothetical protein [Paraurantiacibacter namhicola]|uniref:Glycosyltransferase RgtA/B/C/D-like domain-containing protein n=1 Tax=Paraurantiacibacter namhicola TaxID=645517 RepID=A0A1C7D5U4_9SPHN|nr:hypothetical protein [Paraurantiacibacter namhicola]ANU06866.1 hypothetical protein A6F65_00543 [Paraurantiacibacter namhicola]
MASDRQGRGLRLPLLLIWLGLSALLVLGALANIRLGRFPDPDDTLRLIQVRDLLAGQGWFDLTQYRIAPPEGTPMHWSRLVDAPLAVLIAMLTPLLGQAGAEMAAALIVPLLLLGVTIASVGVATRRMFGRQAAILAALFTGFMPMIVFQLQPLRIDHHGWQIALVALAMAASSMRSARMGGALAGLSMAAGLLVSIELLPLAAAFGLVFLLRGLRSGEGRRWLTSYLSGLAISMIGLFLALRGPGDLVVYCDAISLPHIAFFAITALAAGLSRSASKFVWLGVLSVGGAAGLAVFAMQAPECVGSPFGSLDPLVQRYWYANIAEGMPAWRQDWTEALPALAQLAVALAVGAVLAARSRGPARSAIVDHVLLLALAVLAALLTWRSVAFAQLLALPILGMLAAGLLERISAATRAISKLSLAALLTLVFLPAAPFLIAERIGSGGKDAPVGDPAPGERAAPILSLAHSACDVTGSARKLDSLPTGTVFAPLDLGPAILLGSSHSVVATSHHRANDAMADVIGAFTQSPEEARKTIAARGADYVALCSDVAEPEIYRTANGRGFAAMLLRGSTPEWLEPVDIGAPPQFRVWRVRNGRD